MTNGNTQERNKKALNIVTDHLFRTQITKKTLATKLALAIKLGAKYRPLIANVTQRRAVTRQIRGRHKVLELIRDYRNKKKRVPWHLLEQAMNGY